MEEESKDIQDYLGILRRRGKCLAITTGILILATVVVAILLRPVYRSTATILIEEQDIPPDLVRSTVTSFADERIQVISQQVMSRSVLLNLVEKYNLYATKRRYETSEEILERMRKDIKLTPVNADVADRRSGNRMNVTIAFTLSYDSESPASAQKVASELTSLYLNENVKNRQQKAAETSSFLAEETDRLGKHIAEIEAKLAAFKKVNIGRLPELAPLNLQLSDRTDSEIRQVEHQISLLEDRKIYLEGQITSIKPYSRMDTADSERSLDPADRLKVLRARYASLSGVYAPDHPDLQKMRREIAALQKETGVDSVLPDQVERLTDLKAELAELRRKYSEDHPDVVKLKKTIAALEETQAGVRSSGTIGVVDSRKPDNPVYITFQSQLESANAELQSLRAMRDELKTKLHSYDSRLEQTPQVEREYSDLTREHDNSLSKYREIKAKQLEAQVAQELEKDRKGERFSLIDPPQFPEKPYSPNRPAIFLLGLLLSLGGGLSYAGILEALDSSVKSPRELSRLSQVSVLSVIPYVENSEERARKLKARKITFTVAMVALVVLILMVHFFVIPIEVLWYVISRKLAFL